MVPAEGLSIFDFFQHIVKHHLYVCSAAHPDDGGFADPRCAQHRHLGVVDRVGRRVPELSLPRGYSHSYEAMLPL